VSTLDVVAEVLRETAPRALCVREIVEHAGDRLPTASRTPATVVRRDLAIDIRTLGEASRFARVDRGKFLLRTTLPLALEALFEELCAEIAYASREVPEGEACACLAHAAPVLVGTVDDRQLTFPTALRVDSANNPTDHVDAADGVVTWTGPHPDEVAPSGMLLARVPGDRWPHGPPSAHEARCNLFPHRGSRGGLFCDCSLSEVSASVEAL
jgi:hypothetical protein